MELTFVKRGDDSLCDKALDPHEKNIITLVEPVTAFVEMAAAISVIAKKDWQLLVGSMLVPPAQKEAWSDKYNNHSESQFIVIELSEGAKLPWPTTKHVQIGNRYIFMLDKQLPVSKFGQLLTEHLGVSAPAKVIVLAKPEIKDDHPNDYIVVPETIRNEDPPKTNLEFIDRATDTLYMGTLDIPNNTHTMNKTSWGSSRTNFCAEHNMDKTAMVPSWERVFDPTDNTPMVDVENKKFNTYTQSDYKTNAQKVENPILPNNIDHILTSICVDPETKARFIEWLGYKFQTNRKPMTAWLFTGVPATGKGILFNKIIIPLFSQQYCKLLTQSVVEEKYSSWMRERLFVCLDEANIGNTKSGLQTLDKLKSYITEPVTEVRVMNQDTTTERTFCSFLFFSNHKNAMRIEPGERRLNVAPHQNTTLDKSIVTTQFVDEIQNELPEFANYLASQKINKERVNTAMDNDAKEAMAQNSRGAHSTFMNGILHFDTEYLVQVVTAPHETQRQYQPEGRRIMLKLLAQTTNNTVFITHAEMALLYNLARGSQMTVRDITNHLQREQVAEQSRQPKLYMDEGQRSRGYGRMIPVTLSELEIADAARHLNDIVDETNHPAFTRTPNANNNP
jgi:hypothetical protein